jgi:hypothetical protein
MGLIWIEGRATSMKLSIAFCVAVFVAGGLLVFAAEGGPKHTIKQVMKDAHKDGLLKKVTEGQSTKADKEKLLELYLSLWENKPPKGEEASWTKKTGDLIVNAAKVVLGQEGAPASLKAAVNCKACHDNHKKS